MNLEFKQNIMFKHNIALRYNIATFWNMVEQVGVKWTEVERVKLAAAKYKYWYTVTLIKSALNAGIFMNLNEGKPYSYGRIYAMLREGKDWVADKLIAYAAEHPRK